MAQYTLPDLPYDYAALEPHYSGQDPRAAPRQAPRRLRRGRQHTPRQARPRRATRATSARSTGSRRTSRSTCPATSCTRCSGRTSAPTAAASPRASSRAAIDEHFGTFEGFKAQLTEAAHDVQGSGWGALSWEPLGQRLHRRAGLRPPGQRRRRARSPLLVIDTWEHAFYLQYKNVKADWVKAFWEIVNWADVAARFDKTRGVVLP